MATRRAKSEKLRFGFQLAERTHRLPGDGATVGVEWIHVEGGGLPYPVQIRVAVFEDGELTCTGLKLAVRLDDERRADWRVTASSLREIPLERILRELKKHHGEVTESHAGWFDEGAAGAQMPPATVPKPKPGLRGHDRTFYTDIARAYQEARRRNPACTFPEFARQWNDANPARSGAVGTIRAWVRRGEQLLVECGEP